MTISRIFSVCAAALVVFACHAPALEEEIRLPEKQESVVVPERTTIPFSLQVSTEATKVSYAGGSYQFKEGDKLHVKGVTRTDIEGDLTQNGDVWSGDLSYLTSEGVPADNTALKVTLVHADNTDTESYASAIVGSDNVSEVTTANLLQYAVEHYSLFTADVTFETTSAALKQQATFLDVKVTFKFDGTHEVGGGGDAKINLYTSLGDVLAHTAFVRQSETSHNYDVHFMAVIPGDAPKDAFTLTVVDRAITFSNNDNLERNKKYTVTREIIYGPQLGDPLWSDGTYGRMTHPDPSATIIGIIVYVNHSYTPETEEANIDNAITEAAAGYGHGLVMALHNVAAGSGEVAGLWGNDNGARWCLSGGNGVLRTGTTVTTPKETLGIKALNGLANTNAIVEALGANSAAYLAQNYAAAAAPANTSGWFLPSIGQWLYTISIDGFGGADPAHTWKNNNGKNWLNEGSIGDLVRVINNSGSTENLLVKSLNDRLETLKSQFAPDDANFYDAFGWSVNGEFGDNYWTSSEYDPSYAFRMNLGSVEPKNGSTKYSTIKPKQESKTSTYTYKQGFIMRIRPFLAF